MRKIALLAFLGMVSAAQAQPIVFTTEDYPPYNFREGTGYSGVGYEQVIAIMQGLDTEYTVDMMPWARAIALAETSPMHCVFTTAHIAEREGRFKWVEPLAIDRNVMISSQASGIKVRNIAEARRYTVGTQRDDYTQALLERNGFPKIDLATDLNLTLKKLLSGRIDLMPISEKYYYELRQQGNPLESQFILSEQKFSVACNRDFPDDILSQMQAGLDRLIKDGTQAALLKKYDMAPAE
ncbi:MAG: substrate-binding periplasmic protein [Allorhizobium sp.]